MSSRTNARLIRLGLVGGLTALGLTLLGLAAGPALAQDERTIALVTIAEANAHCLSTTKTMNQTKATALADRFLEAKEVAASSRQAVTSHRDFQALKADYIKQQGGCDALVKALKK